MLTVLNMFNFKESRELMKKAVSLFIAMTLLVSAISAAFVSSAKAAEISSVEGAVLGSSIDMDKLHNDGTSLYGLEFDEGTLKRADGSVPGKYSYKDFSEDLKIDPNDIQIPEAKSYSEEDLYQQFAAAYSEILSEDFAEANIKLDKDPLVTAKADLEKRGVAFPSEMTVKDKVYTLIVFAVVSLSEEESRLMEGNSEADAFKVEITKGMTPEQAFASCLREAAKEMKIGISVPDDATPEQIVAAIIKSVIDTLKMIPDGALPFASFKNISFSVPEKPTYEQIAAELIRCAGKYLGYEMNLPANATLEQAYVEFSRNIMKEFGIDIPAGSSYKDTVDIYRKNIDTIAKNAPDGVLKIMARMMGISYTADEKGEEIFNAVNKKSGIFDEIKNDVFDSNVTEYKLILSKKADKISFTPMADDESKVTVNGNPAKANAEVSVPLSGKETPITIDVKNTTTNKNKTYKVTVVQPDSGSDNETDKETGSKTGNPATGDAVSSALALTFVSAAAVTAFRKKKSF